MTNEFYNESGAPSTSSAGSSSAIRAEFALIAAGFAKLPTMTGNGGEILAINSGGTSIESLATTGTGSAVRATSPTLVTPTLGVASATSINKVTLTAPATGCTITLSDGKTLTVSNTLTLTATDGATLAIGAGGTLGTGAYATIADYAPLASPTFTGTLTAAALTATGTVTFSGGGSMTGTWSNLGTVTTIDINGGTIDATAIGGATPAAGSFTSLNASGGGALTGTWTNLGSVTTVDINGGTVDGAVIGGAAPAAITGTTVSDSKGNVREIPQNSQGGAYVVVAGDSGKHISITTGGVTLNTGTLTTGMAVTIYNASASSQTITQGAGVTLRNAGTSSTGNRTLAQRGLATILCVGAEEFVISGAGVS